MLDNGALASIVVFVGDAPLVWIDFKALHLQTGRQFLPEQQRGFKSPVDGNIYTAVYVCLTAFLADILLVSFWRDFCQ